MTANNIKSDTKKGKKQDRLGKCDVFWQTFTYGRTFTNLLICLSKIL